MRACFRQTIGRHILQKEQRLAEIIADGNSFSQSKTYDQNWPEVSGRDILIAARERRVWQPDA